MSHITFVLALALGFCLAAASSASNAIAYAQQIAAPSSSHSSSSALHPTGSATKLHDVKIASPTKGQQVPIGKNLTVSGLAATRSISTSGNTAASHCDVSVIANDVKPYQPAKGTGPGGAADYSTWNFVLSSKYTSIKQGPSNKITAKYSCSGNPKASFYSVNVTGVGAHAKPALIASTHTPINASPHAQILSAPPHTHSLSPTATALKQKEQQPVVIGNSDRSTTSSMPSNPVAPKTSINYAPKPLVTPTSSSSNMAGFNSSAIIAGLNIPTSGTAAAISYEQPIAPSTTTSSNSNIGGPVSVTTSSPLTGFEPNGPTSNAGSTTDHSSHRYDSSSNSVSRDKSTTEVSHHTHKAPRIHSSSSSVSHHQDTGSYKAPRIHSSSSSVSHHQDTGSGGIHTLHDKVNELKNSIMGDVKKELESDGVHVSLP
jgi:hypothetical protein